MKATNLVFEIEEQCEYFAKDIRKKICTNIIDSLNEKMTGVEGDRVRRTGYVIF